MRRDSTVSFDGKRFEVPYELTGQMVVLVVDPHAGTVLRVASLTGQALPGQAATTSVVSPRISRDAESRLAYDVTRSLPGRRRRAV